MKLPSIPFYKSDHEYVGISLPWTSSFSRQRETLMLQQVRPVLFSIPMKEASLSKTLLYIIRSVCCVVRSPPARLILLKPLAPRLYQFEIWTVASKHDIIL